jgi:metallophosphoesterase superfamily enzyme
MAKRRKRCWRKPRRSWSGKRCDDEKTAGQEICVAAAGLVADYAGVLYWPEQSLLAFADLHLEKGSSFAGRGMLLPPYDTAATLARLAGLVHRFAPRVVIALGDSFHDSAGPARIAAADRAALGQL